MSRLLFWLGAAVLAAGIVALTLKLAGGDSGAPVGPAKGFQAQLPPKQTPLKNADGVTVKRYEQLDPEIRSTLRTFLVTAVKRQDLARSWRVVAPSLKEGFTKKQWARATALPIIPYQFDSIDRVNYHLMYATTDEIAVEVGLGPAKNAQERPKVFRAGLRPFGKGAHKRWLVDYWMPRGGPPVPLN